MLLGATETVLAETVLANLGARLHEYVGARAPVCRCTRTTRTKRKKCHYISLVVHVHQHTRGKVWGQPYPQFHRQQFHPQYYFESLTCKSRVLFDVLVKNFQSLAPRRRNYCIGNWAYGRLTILVIYNLGKQC